VAELVRSPASGPPPGGGRAGLTPSRALAAGLLAVVAFWWAATGVTIAMQRDGLTRAASAVAATLLAAWAVRVLLRARDERTPGSAFRSFAGGALLWGWVSTLFYGGVVRGVPDTGAPAAAGPSLALAGEAIAATLYSDLLSIGVILLVARLTWGSPNRVGLWSLLLFWGAHQTAKLNVFFGVRHAGAEFLPADLAYLERYFGPARNSPLLAVTVAALAALAAWLGYRAWRAPSPFARTACAMLATLTALALLEHAVLGLEAALPLWNMFLRARG
jgi:putative photosynthetic complex assembly protein 2